MRSRKRLIFLVLATVALAALMLAPEAFAGAGGGTASFGGGGGDDGGGSSGFGGGGGGHALAYFFLFRIILDIAVLGHGIGALVLIALAFAWWFWTHEEPKIERWWQGRNRQGRAHRRETRRRERKVELAAAEAADQNPVFDPDRVRSDAAELFTDIQLAWGSDDRSELKSLITPELYVEWDRRLDEFARMGWQNKVEPVGHSKVEFVGIKRRRDASPDGSATDGDQVTVKIEAKLRDYVLDRSGKQIRRDGALTQTTRMREYWTLERRGDRWMLASIESGAEGDHALQDQIVQTNWADEGALRDEAMVEGAAAQQAPTGTDLADLADLSFVGDARAAALDLSLADGRFSPDILEIAARRAVSAWATAVDGSDAELMRLASPAVVRELLHPEGPGSQSRQVVRGVSVQRIRVTGLNAGVQPPTMTIDVDLRGYRYLEDRDTTKVLAGSATRQTGFTERWTLALTENSDDPWRIVGSQTPAVAR